MDFIAKQNLLLLLQSLLGEYKIHGNNESSFHCPFCHHKKKKLDINLFSGKWHCWICNSKGYNLFQLFDLLNSSNDQVSQLKSIIQSYKSNINIQKVEGNSIKNFKLPSEFITLSNPENNIKSRHALKYLHSRRVFEEDIVKYNIGYCPDGIYRDYIIIPSYDSNMKLNYFIARNFYDYGMKYKNPPISKNQIIFESHVSYNLPIVLVEGVFDSIAIKRNSIPLLGKTMSKKLYDKILEKDMRSVYVMLDSDASMDSFKILEKLQKRYIQTSLVSLDDKDPSDVGFLHGNNLIKNSSKVDFKNLIKLKFA